MLPQLVKFLIELWNSGLWVILAVPAALIMGMIFLMVELFQSAVQGRRWWVALIAMVGFLMFAVVAAFVLFLAGLAARTAIWTTVTLILGLGLISLFTEVRIFRKWFAPKPVIKMRATSPDGLNVWISLAADAQSSHEFGNGDEFDLVNRGATTGDYTRVKVRLADNTLVEGWMNLAFAQAV